MNVGNERIERLVQPRGNTHVEQITEEEMVRAPQKMKCGEAIGPNNLPVEAWEVLVSKGIDCLTIFTNVVELEEMPEEWRNSTLIHMLKK